MQAGVSLVAALDEDGVIGRDGDLPWRLPNDLRRFRALTLGHRVLMGRRTFDSIGKPLSGRDNWVVSASPTWSAPGCRRFASVREALAAGAGAPLMVIGGENIYRQTIDEAEVLLLTRVHARVGGDRFFPAFPGAAWREAWREDHPADASHPYAYSFIRLERTDSTASA